MLANVRMVLCVIIGTQLNICSYFLNYSLFQFLLSYFKGKLSKIEDELSYCETCNHLARASHRPKVALPRAGEVNEVVSIDLKILEADDPDKKKYTAILYLLDEYTKVIKGRLVKNKEPKSIVQAIHDAWIIGDGCGPGHPTSSFYSDNGGEFLNEATPDFAAKWT